MSRRPIFVALLVGATLLSTTGCDDSKKKNETAVKIFKSVEECRIEYSEEVCKAAFQNAQTQHEAQAPHTSREDCIAKYGADACVRHDDGGNNWFGPAMAGFMIGHMINNTPSAQPVYIDRFGSVYSGTRSLGSYRPSCSGRDCNNGGFVTVAPGSTASWTRNYSTTTIRPSTRGGFSVSAPIGRGPSSISAPSAPSIRGGFGASAAGASAGG